MTYVSTSLRQLIRERSGTCCEYCRIPESAGTATFHIEHIIAVSHGGLTDEPNLALSCPVCNHHIEPNIAAADPETGEPTFLYHPRRDVWDEHFTLDGAVIRPLTAEGRTTVAVLHFNDQVRVEQRKVLLRLSVFPCIPPSFVS